MCMCYDPAKVAGSPSCVCAPGNCTCGPSCDCPCCWGNGPGGNSTIVAQNNEKGILETGLQAVISHHVYADLGSNHDPERQGIYRTNSVGDHD